MKDAPRDRAVVIDLFSRAFLGWKLSDSLHADLSSMPPHVASNQDSCPGEQSFTPIAAPILGHHHP